MLLLMVEPQLEQVAFLRAQTLGQPRLHPAVDLVAIGHDLIQRRPRHQPSFGTIDPLAQGLVVGVEQLAKLLVDGDIVWLAGQDHRLEEPTDMAQMPLARTGFRHGLGPQIFRRQARGETPHLRPHPPIDRSVLFNGRGCPKGLAHSLNAR
ncbi:hypothetical protein D3C80_1113630 [compost metagenome]